MVALPGGERVISLVTRALRVRRSETDRTVRVAALAVVMGLAMVTGYNATQVIFLTRAGPGRFPVFFIYVALTVWPVVAIQGTLSRRLGTSRALRQVLLLNAAVPILLYFAYLVREDGNVALAAYVIFSVLFEMVLLQFWAFAAQHFNLLEGKRIFPVIAAGTSVGFILAGVTTSLLATLTGGPEPLLFVWAAGALVSAWIARQTERRLRRPAITDEGDEALAEAHADRHRLGVLRGFWSSLLYLRASRLVLALTLAALLLLSVMRVSDYLVALVFVRLTDGDLQSLTVLIGNAWSLAYGLQLALGLLVTPLVLGRLGVKNALLILPVATLIAFGAVAMAPGLVAAMALFVVRNGIATGVDDPAEQVLAGALPEHVQPRLKILFNELVVPGSAAITGIGLLGLQATIPSITEGVLAVVGIGASLLFLLAAIWVRSLYVSAIYQRLKAHALSINDLEQALGRPDAQQIGELEGFIRGGDTRVRHFAAGALSRLAPDRFVKLIPELAEDQDAHLRRLALQLAPAGSLPAELLDRAASDPDPWVVAAAAVAGAGASPPWERTSPLLAELRSSSQVEARAAAVWAASHVVDEHVVVDGLADPLPRVRLEAIRSFAHLKANVRGAAEPLIACLQDQAIEVRREALQQAIRWAPPAAESEHFAAALIAGLTSGDQTSRRLAAEAMAIQCPGALEQALPLLYERNETSGATVEALVRSGRPDLVDRADAFLKTLLKQGTEDAEVLARLRLAARYSVTDVDVARLAILRIALEDYQVHVFETSLAALRAQHGKRGFATVERGLRSSDRKARVTATETLLNFGPGWLAGPVARLLEPESFEGGTLRPLSQSEVLLLEEHHPDKWVKEGAQAVRRGVDQRMKDLIALKKVPLFATLTLEQLASIDRLMVTRHYLKGDQIVADGQLSAEMYVVLDGEVRIHRDVPGQEVTLARLGPSSFFGEMSLFDELPRSASAQAATDCTLRVLRKERLNAIVHEHPEVLLEVTKTMSQRLRATNEQLEERATEEIRLSGGAAKAG
jgi:hypothetical protein